MSSKPKKEKKKDKKEKQKKSEIKKADEGAEDQQKSIKSNIFSMLDEIDTATKEKSKATEEKLRRGLIERNVAEKREEIKEKEVRISEIKKEIEGLRDIKQNYYDKGDNIKTIEISKKIIDLATTYDMLFIATEEKTFVDQVQNKIIKTPTKTISEQIENLKKIRHAHYARKKYEKAIEVSDKIIELAIKENLISVVKEEKKFISLMKDKINAKTSGRKMLETLKVEDAKESQIERDMIKEKVIVELGIKKIGGKDKIEEERQKLEEEKQNFEVEKQKFEEKKQKFEEEKEAFDWEKQMFEEVKKFEQDKVKEDTTKDLTKQDSKIIINEEIEKFEKDKSEFGEQKELFEQEKQKFRDIEEQIKQEKLKLEEGKEKFKQEKLELEEKKNLLEKNWLKFEEKKNKLKQEQQILEEEKETFKWEKQMLEEVKKFEAEKDSS